MTRLAALAALALVAAPAARDHLPNLVELPPASLEVTTAGDRALLHFTSTVVNAGAGALVVVSARPRPDAPFATVQVLGARRVPLPVEVRYRRSGGHDHFHLIGFERYELRDGAGRLVRAGHKAGYCLSDRLSLGPSRPRWTGSCGRGHPRALRIAQGISPGFADPYGPELGGQAIDVTGLPAGEYVLVNVVNPSHVLLESAYGDDAAAVRFLLTRPPAPAGIAFVRVLASCRSARCP